MHPESAPLPAHVLEAAGDWLMRLHDAPHDSGQRAACAAWCAQHPDHARAWQRAQRLQDLFRRVPPALALPVLGRSPDARRRAAIKRIGLWLAALPAGGLGWELLAPTPTGTTVRTAVGERRLLSLPDGSRVHLDTDTRLGIRFDAHERGLQLTHGRIRVDSGADSQVPARPLQVHTPHGTVQALGTRFDVQLHDDRTALALLEGTLEIRTGKAAAWRLQAGEQGWFNADGGHAVRPLDDTDTAWPGGMLIADRRPLGALLAELGRYRRGLLRCDPEVAGIPVSGAFPVDDSDRTLALIEAAYPVRVQRTAGGWWTTVVAR
jgi:transmembrane sensor